MICSLLTAVIPARANDIVPTTDITGSASVFVFRGSSKKPQAAAASMRSFRAGAAAAETTRRRMRAQTDIARQRRARAAKARQAELARIRARERNARLRQSNILTSRAETQLENGEIESAISNYREALSLNSNNADAALGLSDALIAKGIEASGEDQDGSVLAYFEEASKLNPKNEVAFLKIGEIHDTAGRNSEAIANYEKALALDTELSAVYFPLGMAYAEAGNDTKAEEYLLKAEVVGASTSESLTTRAVILSRQGRNDEAILLFDRAISIDPAQGGPYSEKARLFIRMGREDDAYRALRQGSDAAPGSAAVWFDLGVLAYNRGDYATAVNAYLRVIELDPASAQAHANLASTYRQMERFAEANAQYRAAHDKGIDKDADLFSEWGYCLGQTKEWDKAMVRLDTAKELSPTAIDYNNAGWAYYNAARLERQNKNDAEAKRKLELARASLEKAVEMDSGFYAAFLNLGATNNSLGEFEAAKAALEKALLLQNDWLIAMNQLGVAHRGSSDYPRAIDQFTRVTQIDSNDLFSLYNLGELHYLTGNRREARRVSDRLKRLDPTLAKRLDDVLSGKIVLDEARKNIRRNIPTIRRRPY